MRRSSRREGCPGVVYEPTLTRSVPAHAYMPEWKRAECAKIPNGIAHPMRCHVWRPEKVGQVIRQKRWDPQAPPRRPTGTRQAPRFTRDEYLARGDGRALQSLRVGSLEIVSRARQTS